VAGRIQQFPLVFSFFKKKGSGPEAPPAPEKRPEPKPAAADFDVEPHRTLAGIEVSDGGSGLSGAAEEATILYAHGRTSAAMDLLVRGVAEGGELRRNPLAWFMLFDLFQIQGMRQEFEKLALDFVVEFERSAPVWTEIRALGSGPAGGGTTEKAPPLVALTGILSQSSTRQIAELEAAAGREGGVRLDVSRLRGVDDTGCTLLLGVLERLQGAGRSVAVVGCRALDKLLRAEIETSGKSCTQGVWLLLLKLCQFEGNQQEFENLSLDFAVAYEVSPPPWEPLGSVQAAEPVAEYAPDRIDPVAEALSLAGVMLGPNPPALAEIMNYAASRTVVNLDMARVRRVDFVAAGALLNVFMGLSRGGKGIMIHGANEMIQALFGIVGINHHVVIARDKQH
jgi:ABC-type transporter Mla MlaB component